MIKITDSSYTDFISNNRCAVIGLDAVWNTAADQFMHSLVEAEKAIGGSIAFAIVDVDRCPNIVAQLGILNVPTIVYFRGGVEILKTVGRPRDLKENIAALLNEPTGKP